MVKWRELDDKLKYQNRELGRSSRAAAKLPDLQSTADSDSDDESETVAELRSLLGDLSLSERRRFVADESIDTSSQFLRDVLSDRAVSDEQARPVRPVAGAGNNAAEDVPAQNLDWDLW